MASKRKPAQQERLEVEELFRKTYS